MSNTHESNPGEYPVLKQNAQGEWVVFLQDALNGCGFGVLDLDGDFGTQTLSLVSQFQQRQGLSVNGVVDAATWNAIATHEKQLGWQPQLPDDEIRTGIAGADTLNNVTPALVQTASGHLGATPQFWGRYFQGDSSGGEYLHDLENAALHQASIRVLPISRWTDRVGGSRQSGTEVGQIQAKDLLETFNEDYLAAQGDGFYFFLDVEGMDGNPQPSLSQAFYLGWAEAVVKASHKVRLMPCVYLNGSDRTTLSNLSATIKAGAECHGLWVANYGSNTNSRLRPWDREAVKLETPVPCKVLIHQYVGDVDDRIYDFNQINPFLEQPELVLKRLILPPQT